MGLWEDLQANPYVVYLWAAISARAQVAVGTFERRYLFYLYVKRPQEVFTLHPKFVRAIMEAWDKARG